MLSGRNRWIVEALLIGLAACSSATTNGNSPLDGLQTTATGSVLASGGTAVGTGAAFAASTGGALVTGGTVVLTTGGAVALTTGGVVSGTGGVATGGTGGVAATGGTTYSNPGQGTCLQAGNGNYSAPGPYVVATMDIDLGTVEAGQTTGAFRIFYPSPLESECLHPIVAWGNGTAVNDYTTYEFLNSNAASWGMVVIASEDPNTGSGNFHKAGLDYLLAQNNDPSSMFYQKLSTRAGVSGHSQGGMGANMASSHPNVETASIEGMSMSSSAKVSVLIMTGTADVVDVNQVAAEVPGAAGPMFLANWEGGDHFTTETLLGFIQGDAGSLQFQRLHAAWFRCFLADDTVACGLFGGGTPSNCGICGDPGWHSLTSNIP